MKPKARAGRNLRAVTLVELLATVVIIGILATAITLSVFDLVNMGQDQADSLKVKTWRAGARSWQADNQGTYPPSFRLIIDDKHVEFDSDSSGLTIDSINERIYFTN